LSNQLPGAVESTVAVERGLDDDNRFDPALLERRHEPCGAVGGGDHGAGAAQDRESPVALLEKCGRQHRRLLRHCPGQHQTSTCAPAIRWLIGADEIVHCRNTCHISTYVDARLRC